MNVNRRNFIRAGAALATLAATIPTTVAKAAMPLNLSLLERAKNALNQHRAVIANRDVIGIADFGAGSEAERFHIIDLRNGMTNSMLVAHGKGSDPGHTGWLQRFSNVPGSNATSQGAYLTASEYVGQHGRSRRLIGLDPENDEAEARAIVLHSASYVSPSIATGQGRIGRSLGCLAVSRQDLATAMGHLPPGSLIYAGKS